MTTRRVKEKVLTSLDRTLPVPINYRTDLKVNNDIEQIYTNTENRLTKDDIASIFSGSASTTDGIKLATSARPTVEILRANSPTLKRLLAARAKLEKYVYSKSNISPTSRLSIHVPYETSYLTNNEKQTITNGRISSSKRGIQSQKHSGSGPLDRITYEKARAHNGHVKQKCSLEIWLPKAGPDDDDDDDVVVVNGNIGHTTPPYDSKIIEKKSPSPLTTSIKSRRSSIMKSTTVSTTNVETKSVDETSSKKSEPTVVPRVYHYEEYLTDHSEERPRSSRSGNTNKSESKGSTKSLKHPRTRPHAHRLSSSTHAEDIALSSSVVEKPMTSKNLLANIKRTNNHHETKGGIGPNNSLMITELMRKYSMIKRSHQELTHTKMLLDKSNSEFKNSTLTMKDNSLPTPPTSDSASHASSDLAVSARKALRDISPPRSPGNHSNMNAKLLERRSGHHKTSHPDSTTSQTRLISIIKHFQQRHTSATMSRALLPVVVGKKSDDPFHYFERSKTLNVTFDASMDHSNQNLSQLPSAQIDNSEFIGNSSNPFPRRTHGIEPISTHHSKRSLPPASITIHSDEQSQKQPVGQPLVQLVQYQNIQNSAQRYHHSAHTSAITDAATNKTLVHLKYSNGGNTDRNCLVPE